MVDRDIAIGIKQMANGQSLHIQLKSCRYQEMNAGDVQYSKVSLFALVPGPPFAISLYLWLAMHIIAASMDNSNNN